MTSVQHDETLEGILAIFRQDGALFVLVEVLMEDDVQVDEYLEDWR